MRQPYSCVTSSELCCFFGDRSVELINYQRRPSCATAKSWLLTPKSKLFKPWQILVFTCCISHAKDCKMEGKTGSSIHTHRYSLLTASRSNAVWMPLNILCSGMQSKDPNAGKFSHQCDRSLEKYSSSNSNDRLRNYSLFLY